MTFVCPAEKCTGCSACVNICPLNAIELKPDKMGFLYPVVRQNMCIDCKKCQSICPQNAEKQFNARGDFFAGVSFDDAVKERSSSGGMFSLFAEKIIRKGGVVFGAAYDESLKVRHIGVDNIAGLQKLRGSKYVQSEMGNAYSQVKKLLSENRFVLFSGTPCQIDGLYSFLGDISQKNLYTIDVLCHGVPSPAILSAFIENENRNSGKAVKALNFRSKSTGWLRYSTNIRLSDGLEKETFRDSYMRGFLNNYYLRECCYNCNYTSPERTGDITLGDFWGYREKAPAFLEDDDRGISLVIVNNKHGYMLLKGIKFKAALVKKDYEDALRGNPILCFPSKRPDDYENFHNDFDKLNWEELSEKYFPAETLIPPTITEENKAYFSQSFKKRYYKHLISCKISGFTDKLKGGN